MKWTKGAVLVVCLLSLAAAYCSNSLLLVDSFANVKRIEKLVKTLDVGTPYKPDKCTMPSPAAQHDGH
jgi:hypothetical protein